VLNKQTANLFYLIRVNLQVVYQQVESCPPATQPYFLSLPLLAKEKAVLSFRIYCKQASSYRPDL